MNKTKIKNFSIWARRNLIDAVAYHMRLLGIDEKGIRPEMEGSSDKLKLYDMGTSKPAEVADKDISKRDHLARHIQDHQKKSDYKTAYETVVEEIAYTWFNRLIAIRFMEVNDYLPSGVRVLSSTSGKPEPDIVTKAEEVASKQGFTISTEEIWKLKDENKLDELFRILFIAQCRKLHEILPELFDNSQSDFTELLLPISFIDNDGFIRRLVTDIDEGDFVFAENGQVEIIGWLYQYYNTEKKDAVFAAMSKKIKVSKENIPAATQLFTPHWIVQYMVENSLGRLWLDGHADSSAKTEWKYYLEEAEQTPEVQAQLAEIREGRKNLSPEQIRFIDPCMGSGHILVYAFDVLMQIYLSCGYTERDAAHSIARNNLWGLDLDKRAYQLAYFAVMMKVRQYDRRLWYRITELKTFDAHLPNLSHFQDLPNPNYALLDEPIRLLAMQFENADNYGSLISVQAVDGIDEAIDKFQIMVDFNFIQLEHLMRLYIILSQKYDVVCTNPPYMSSGNMNGTLNDFIKQYYPDSKADYFACFIEKCEALSKTDGYFAMITQHSWMFISSYETLRYKILKNRIISLVQLGIKAFEEIGNDVVQTCSFIMQRNIINDYKSIFVRLTNYKNFSLKRDQFFNFNNHYISSGDFFFNIPGIPFAYWVSRAFIDNFSKGKRIEYYGTFTGSQNITGDNDRFLRYFWEINGLSINDRWHFYAKGGDYRQYYGNLDIVVDWSSSAQYFYKTNKTSNLLNESLWYLEGITYSAVTSRGTGFRYLPKGCIFDKGGPSININSNLFEILAFFNSNVAKYYFWVFNPSINLQVKDVKNTPIILSRDDTASILAEECTELCKTDWDSFETSWDFKAHPFVKWAKELWDATAIGATMSYYYGELPEVSCPLELCYLLWQGECNDRFNKLKANEEELNRIFIQIYGLQDELTPEVEDRDVTVRKADLQRDMRSFVSYAVGCMFGRYSLDVEGLAYAGGEWDSTKYRSFIPDAENCLPITEEPFFEDDIVTQFAKFVETVYGSDTLEENLRFVAENLGIKGNGTAREKIRQYFLKEFFKDHCKIYQKRPIYWLFDTGKKNGFKALCYLHRWDVNTVGNVRIDYMHKLQRLYRNEIIRLRENIDKHEDVARSEKRLEKIISQLQETEEYDAKIGIVVAARIEIDLDDGVKVNYDRVQTGSDGKKYQILATI